MPVLRLPSEIAKRRAALADKAARSRSVSARKAILRQIEDIEDGCQARRRLARRGPRVTLASMEPDFKRRMKR